MELIPTFKEKEINILELDLLGAVNLAENNRLNNILEAVENYGSELTTEEVVKLIEYKEKSQLYLHDLIKVLEKDVNEEYSYNTGSYYDFINDVQGIILEKEELIHSSTLFISEVALEVLTEIETVNKILCHVKTSNKKESSSFKDNTLINVQEMEEE